MRDEGNSKGEEGGGREREKEREREYEYEYEYECLFSYRPKPLSEGG